MNSQSMSSHSSVSLQALSALGTAVGAAPRTVVASTMFEIVEEPFLQIASLRLSRRVDREAALRAWPSALPQTPNQWSGDAQRCAARFEPNAWMLIGESVATLPGGDGCLLTDLSSRLASVRIRGAHAAQVLASATAAPLEAQAFVRTQFAETAAVLIQRLADEDYRVLIDVSLAEYLVAWLADAGRLQR